MAPGNSVMVVGVDAGRRACLRLESMGIMPGILLEVVSNGHGPMIISTGEGRIMVERGIAEKVLVA
ncbi:FeoA family protein [Pseudodesulfovibrio tunisiensis]|uniref:FeoA family protein n=1 Tax=Pseudodesulfovibrio tunisiensis TaxID=463192 RepID=UPI001FB3B50E